MIPISFARLGFGLEGRKALNPTQSQEQSVIKAGLKLLEQLKNKVNNQMLKNEISQKHLWIWYVAEIAFFRVKGQRRKTSLRNIS